MSLYKFFESFIEENPDLIKISSYTNPISYEDYYYLNRNKQKRFEIESFLDPLFNENLVRCSATRQEYEDLKIRAREISQVAQKLFTLSILNDKLEKEKNQDLFKQKVNEYEMNLK